MAISCHVMLMGVDEMAKLQKVEGIGEAYAKKLEGAGITTTEGLLEKGATPKGREELAKMTKIPASQILKWVNHVDLFRVKGVGAQYAELLEAAGVDTVPELAQRKPDHLLQKMIEVNEKSKKVRQLPSINRVKEWVEQAKNLPRVVTY